MPTPALKPKPIVAGRRTSVWSRLVHAVRGPRPRSGPELREDPRDNPLRSLQNLLRLRAHENGWDVLAIGTSYDVLMAQSGPAGAGDALLIEAREAIEVGKSTPTALRFAVGRQLVVVAAPGRVAVPHLLEIAQRIRCILHERDELVAA